MKFIFICITLNIFSSVHAYDVDDFWREGRKVPINGVNNPYQLSPQELEESTHRGLLHSLNYPVETTGLLIPVEPMKNALESRSDHPFKRWLQKLARNMTPWRSFDEMTSWLGLHPYPEKQEEAPYYVPLKNKDSRDHRMGVTLIETENAQGFTFSCTTCHASNLFGKRVIGLNTRFPRANQLFVIGKKALRTVPAFGFKFATEATQGEKRMYHRSRKNIRFVESKNPTFLGLDTALAIVSLSLSWRANDEWASKKRPHKLTRRGWRLPPGVKYPRQEPLRNYVADSKPGVWWLSKYKNRWLSDGSIVSGSPVITNLLWNEIGRGGDLKNLQTWIDNNPETIKDLTTAVYNTKAPRITDFFDASHFDLEQIKVGQKIYNQSCAKCHGRYKKVWDLEDSELLPKWQQLATYEVHYPEQTPVKDVGTDPQRYIGMKSLEQLNDLAISKAHGIKIQTQKGYVPQPLVGIWARWPYFHNNSIPNLCALFTPPESRPVTYYSGAAIDKYRDFDLECNGYPLAEDAPESWKTPDHLFDTRKAGMSNSGHYKKTFLNEEGEEIYTWNEKYALIQFLQTL
jgi:hypothetical protein